MNREEAIEKVLDVIAPRDDLEGVATSTEINDLDHPIIKHTPGGWLAVAVDVPRIAVIGATEDEAVVLFRTRRSAWRELMAQATAASMDDETE